MAEVLELAVRETVRPQDSFERLRWPYDLALPLFYALGAYAWLKKKSLAALRIKVRTNSFFVDGISINSRRMKEGATRWPSLDTCYNFTSGQGPTVLHRIVDTWWMNIRNAQAVRNRLKIAKHELRIAIEQKYRPGHPVKILSLASGSAQGVIEVAAELAKRGIETKLMLVDHDVTALRHARDLSHRHGVEITTIEGNVLRFDKVIPEDYRPDITEMMGFLDYLSPTLSEFLLRRIRRNLAPEGTFFCCHIHPNRERFFLKWAVNWDSGMVYRTVPEFEELLHKGGFLTPRILTEPHKIHSVSISGKD